MPGDAAAHGMIEYENARGAGEGLQGRHGLRIVDLFDLIFVVEVLHGALVPDQAEALGIER